MSLFVDGCRQIFVEITSRCNFDCLFCPSGIATRRKGDMPRQTAFDLLAHLHDMGFNRNLYLHVLGEPLLHPDVFDIIDRAADLGMRPILFTNGGALSTNCVQRILSSKAIELVISMQTINRESYEALRKTPFGWNEYLHRIQTALADASESPGTCVFRVSIGVKKADPQHPSDRYFLEYQSPAHLEAGVASIFSKVAGLDIESILGGLGQEDLATAQPVQVNERLRLSVKQMGNWRRMKEREPATKGQCPIFGNEFAILSDGSVVFCHLDYDGDTAVGNAKEQPLEAILSSSEFTEVVKSFSAGTWVPKGCQNCRGVRAP